MYVRTEVYTTNNIKAIKQSGLPGNSFPEYGTTTHSYHFYVPTPDFLRVVRIILNFDQSNPFRDELIDTFNNQILSTFKFIE